MKIRIRNNNGYLGLKSAVGRTVKATVAPAVFSSHLYYVKGEDLQKITGVEMRGEYCFAPCEVEEVSFWHDAGVAIGKALRKCVEVAKRDSFGYALVLGLFALFVVVGLRFQWRELLGWLFV